jgi:hypothetical protein
VVSPGINTPPAGFAPTPRGAMRERNLGLTRALSASGTSQLAFELAFVSGLTVEIVREIGFVLQNS